MRQETRTTSYGTVVRLGSRRVLLPASCRYKKLRDTTLVFWLPKTLIVGGYSVRNGVVTRMNLDYPTKLHLLADVFGYTSPAVLRALNKLDAVQNIHVDRMQNS